MRAAAGIGQSDDVIFGKCFITMMLVLFACSKVETPIHDIIRELITWECEEHGVKS
jgi:hypothetical protein